MRIHQIYVEKHLIQTSRVEAILSRFPKIPVTLINHYGEIFNRKKQNFRIQKETSCLILADKQGQFLHPIPDQFGIGFDEHYYFSPVLNCPFDCQYCFLQGMNRSSHYVIFINCDDFKTAIQTKILKEPNRRYCFFSGYDGDSLALDPLSSFCSEFLPFFEQFHQAYCEVRTKSIAIKPLLELKTVKQTLVAYTLNPQPIIDTQELKTPSLKQRLEAIKKLQQAGYSIALRFDPILVSPNGLDLYREFFREIDQELDSDQIHSATIGTFRFPKPIYQNYFKIHSSNPGLALLEENKNEFSYPKPVIEHYLKMAEESLTQFLPSNKIFRMQLC